MKNHLLLIVAVFVFQSPLSAQQGLSAEEIFEKVVKYYDPNGIWSAFEGTMHIYTIGNRGTGEEDLTINNATGFYRSIKYQNDSTIVKGTKDGDFFYQVNGDKMKTGEMPMKFEKGPYNLNEQSVRTMSEHHRLHFSLPLSLHSAGAKPLAEVGKKNLFGTDCISIQFSGLPNNYENGFYNGAITLYVDPANDYRLHAAHFDNGTWKDKAGVLNLYKGEIEVEGLKIPNKRMYFDAANLNFRFVDAFSTKTQLDEIKNGPHRRLLYFSFKEGTSAEDIQFVKDSFQGLAQKVDGMTKAIWMECPDKGAEFKYSLLLEFDDSRGITRLMNSILIIKR